MEYTYYFLIVDIHKDRHETIIVESVEDASQVRKDYNLPAIGSNGISNDRKYSFAMICN